MKTRERCSHETRGVSTKITALISFTAMNTTDKSFFPPEKAVL